MLRLLEVEPYLIEGNVNEGYTLTYMIEDVDPCEKEILMNYLVENGSTIQKVMWRSRIDRSVISEIEPVPYDAFNCIIIAKNNSQYNLFYALNLYHNRLRKVRYLERCLKGKTCMELEREQNPIDYTKLADSILGLLI